LFRTTPYLNKFQLFLKQWFLLKTSRLQNEPLDEIANKFIESGLHHFIALKHPEEEDRFQLQLYFKTPEKFYSKVFSLQSVKVTPFNKIFWSKSFWREKKEKKTWNPFNKKFWSIQKPEKTWKILSTTKKRQVFRSSSKHFQNKR